MKPEVELFAVSRLESSLKALQAFYGVLPLPPRDPFMLFVWEVLSVHSTPQKRDAALAALKRIPALTPDSMWRAPQKKLEESVRLAGPYTENRLQALRTGCDLFRRSPNLAKTIRGPLPRVGAVAEDVDPANRVPRGGAPLRRGMARRRADLRCASASRRT